MTYPEGNPDLSAGSGGAVHRANKLRAAPPNWTRPVDALVGRTLSTGIVFYPFIEKP
jgi:hypothetical protein